jgi:hypothetical protein
VLQNVEKRFMIKFEEISGIEGYVEVWKELDNICVILIEPNRQKDPQYSPVYNEQIQLVHQVWYDKENDQICWREVC